MVDTKEMTSIDKKKLKKIGNFEFIMNYFKNPSEQF